MAPTTARVFHSSVASPQPIRPGSSVSTRTKTQLRISALHTRALTEVIFNGSSPGVVNVVHNLGNVLCQ